MSKQDAKVYREAAERCFVEYKKGPVIGWAPYYLGCAVDYDYRYNTVHKAFGDFGLKGEEAVLALLFAAAMAETGDL